MNFVRSSVRQPVTVAVGVLLILLSGLVALRRIPIQLTPNVEDTIVAVTTFWEGASPIEVEQEIVDPQEEKLQGIANLRTMTSTSQQGQGVIRLEFQVGTPKEVALREVSDKLREVEAYPENVDEPFIQASDPDNRDYIAWVLLETPDPDFDVRTLQDFAQDRIEPMLERLPGMSEINVLGGRERELHVRYDPALLASKGVTPAAFAAALRSENRDVSAGRLAESKDDVRVRLVGQFTAPQDVENTVIAYQAGNPVFVRDVADVVETYKEAGGFVRSRGKRVLAINAQKEVGANVMAVMAELQGALAELNAPGGLLETHANKLGLEGGLRLTQAYDQTIYIDDALELVQSNIWVGGALAILVLLLFLRSVRTVGIVSLAIPISVVGAIVAMVALGRSINVISLAGMAFAVGMVVDNAIVVLENIYRHVERGKAPLDAAVDGGREVFGAVLASTLTTVAVFIPILLIEEEAGQLFRDIALAIVAAVTLSLVISVTVIPTSAARILRAKKAGAKKASSGFGADLIAGLVHKLNGSIVLRLTLILVMAGASVFGTAYLMPPTDYLPQGNRNLVFGLLIPPPGYNLDQLSELGTRIEETIEPYWEAADLPQGSEERADAIAALPAVPTFDFAAGRPGDPVVPPELDNYFVVAFDGIMFHGAISADDTRVVDVMPLFSQATRAEAAPGVLAFAFQVPLFQLGGTTGSAIQIDFAGEDLEQVADAALDVMLELMGRYAPYSVQPDPSNFNVPTPELQLVPERVRRAEAGLSFEDLSFAVRTLGDGAVVGDYRLAGDSIDIKVLAHQALEPHALDRIEGTPIATPAGHSVPIGSLAKLQRVNAVQQIKRVGRQRAITLQFTPPATLPLEEAVDEVAAILQTRRDQGRIPPSIDTTFAGSASKLDAVRGALLGDGTLAGTLGSSLVLALVVVFLLLAVLFQSFTRPLVILFSVPLATLGGFAALAGVHAWSLSDRYMPVQQLDVLTMLGFVILIGVVVNNAILLVHQAQNFMAGDAGDSRPPMNAREAITEAVRTRVRPIFMSTLTSVGGMAPLVFMPGSGSELYRGLGSVVVGGLLVSTLFTLFLVPLAFSLLLDLQTRSIRKPSPAPAGEKTGLTKGAGATALVVLLAMLPFLAGCRSSHATPDRSAAARESAAAWLPPASTATPPIAVSEPRIDETLAAREPELEALGGPSSWRSHEPSFGPALAGTADSTRDIALNDALSAAVRNNLGLRVRALEADAGAEGVVEAEAAFDAVWFADLDWEELESPSPIPVLGGIPLGTGLSASDRRRLQSGIRTLLRSGATVSIAAFAERFANESVGISFQPDPAYRTGIGIEAMQPLLSGFGSEANTSSLRLAEHERERLRANAEADLLVVAALVEQAYWDLREAHERLAILELLTARGEEVEAVLRERRRFDTEPAQFSDALATVEARRAELVRERALVRGASDALKALLDAPDTPLFDETLLRPTDSFQGEATTTATDLRGALESAFERRPELRAALCDVQDAGVRERLARNLRQPRLDLVARIDAIGEDDGWGDSFSDLAQDDYYGFLIGLRFQLPVGNRAAEAEARRARLQAEAALVRHAELTRDIAREVKDALRDLDTSRRLLGAARTARLAASENLRAFLVEKERRAHRTPELLSLEFDRQDRLARAQLEELHAQANVHRAEAALRRAMGTGSRVQR